MSRKACFLCFVSLVCMWLAVCRASDEQAALVPVLATTEPAGPAVVERVAGGMDGRVSLDLRNIDIIDAIKFLVMKTGINIVTTKAVAGRVTLIVENAPVRDVFDMMIRSNNLAYDCRGILYNVMTQDEYKALYGKNFADVRQVKVFHLQYAIPEHIFSLVDALKSDIGRVLVDTESGSVMVMDSPERIEMIAQALKGFEEQTTVRVFKLNYARAKDIEDVLKSQLDAKKVGLIKSDERNNQVIVQTLPDRMGQIESLINELDEKTKEVVVECYIVKVQLSDEISTGVEWEGLFNLGRQFGLTYLGSTPFASVQSATDPWRSRQATLDAVGYVGSYPFSGTTTSINTATSSIGTSNMHIGVIGRSDFDTIIKLVQTLGKSKILSNPKLAVVNNQEAKIHVGQRDAYVTTTTTTGQSTSTISEQVTFVDVGVLLSVVPTINPDGFVTLKVKAEISSVVDTLITPTKNTIPILDTSQAETTVMAKDGSTIIIGGLRREENTEKTQQTPVIGKIPILGNLFKNSDKTKQRTELLIILTPKIITGEHLVTTTGFSGAGGSGIKPTKEYLGLPSEVFVNIEGNSLNMKGPR